MGEPNALTQDERASRPAPGNQDTLGIRALPWLRAVTIVALLFTFANALWAAWDQDATYDEGFHLGWAARLLDERNDARELFRYDSKTPALLPAVALRGLLTLAGVQSEQALRFATRIPGVALLGVLFSLVAHLARTSNPSSSWMGVLLAALDPNLAAHASIATTDLAYSVVVLALAASVLGRPSRARPAFVGAILGLAFAVKFTAVLLIPVALIVVCRQGDSTAERLRDVGMAVVVACVLTSAFYLFVGTLAPLGSVQFQTPVFKALASSLPGLRLPIPRSILTGIDLSIAHNDPSLWSAYLFGAEHRGGVWYYFAANWLMKTPVALVFLIFTGLWGARRWWRDRTISLVATLFVLHLAYFSFFFATQIGLRFALPCVALACVVAARGLRDTRPAFLAAMALLALVERTPYLGDPIAFTNLTVWPKSRAYWYTADSNLDFGQNRQRVGRYAKELGRSFVMDQATITPGLYVVGANDLTIFASRHSHRWLIENNIPAINVGFTHFAFSITGERFDQYLSDSRIAPPLKLGDGVCAGPAPHYPPGGQVPFEQNAGPGAGRFWVVCVTSRKGADLGFTVTTGRAWFGRVSSQGVCEADLLREGQQDWFRVRSGEGSRLCLSEIPFRRAELPYLTSGYLTVRGQGADVAFRQVPFGSVPMNTYEAASQK